MQFKREITLLNGIEHFHVLFLYPQIDGGKTNLFATTSNSWSFFVRFAQEAHCHLFTFHIKTPLLLMQKPILGSNNA
jgi:hypothetical protein